MNRNKLERELYSQAAGPLQRIRQSITTNLRSGNLTLHSGNKVGLPAWKNTARMIYLQNFLTRPDIHSTLGLPLAALAIEPVDMQSF